MDELGFRGAVDLGTKLFHKGVECVVFNRVFISPDRVDNGIAPQHSVWMSHHELKQKKLGTRQTDRTARTGRRMGQRIQLQVFHPVKQRGGGMTSASQSPETGKQLIKGKRLGEIMV